MLYHILVARLVQCWALLIHPLGQLQQCKPYIWWDLLLLVHISKVFQRAWVKRSWLHRMPQTFVLLKFGYHVVSLYQCELVFLLGLVDGVIGAPMHLQCICDHISHTSTAAGNASFCQSLLSWHAILFLLVPQSLSCADKHLLAQLQDIDSINNSLVGVLPESWGNLTNVSPFEDIDLMMHALTFWSWDKWTCRNSYT